MPRVLDAWPICKWLQGEQPFAGRVRSLIEGAARTEIALFMNWVNAGEVFYTLAEQHGEHEAQRWVLQLLPAMPIQMVEPDKGLVLAAARWKSRAKISYADAFSLATADRLGAMVITGDREMKGLDTVEWIGA